MCVEVTCLIKEVLFILHATDKVIPSPLPDWAKTWVRTAKRAGQLLNNGKLRTRDIYGLKEAESVYEVAEFVIYVPLELNPQLRETTSVTQKLFRLGSSEVPMGEQIVILPMKPLSGSEALNA